MAYRYLFTKITDHPLHLPTWFFIIGFPMYWVELYIFKAREGLTSPLAWILFMFIACAVTMRHYKPFYVWGKQGQEFWNSIDDTERFWFCIGVILSIGILIVSILASLKPIHLMQEFDCMQYHYALPRQHLILGSFAHIPWAADDLFLLPIDFALSSFWFATVLPNKLPQMIIFVGLLALLVRLALAMTKSNPIGVSAALIFAVLGSHGFGIQMGTGMLDLIIAYLFFAALDSLRKGQWLFAGVEFAFFFWSKPLMPLQVTVVGILLAVIWVVCVRFKCQIISGILFQNLTRSILAFMVLSVLIAFPFVMKSIQYAGTPLFPLVPGILKGSASIQQDPRAWESLVKASHIWTNGVKDGYGLGRDAGAFIKHWWLLAVPQKGVNNAFDYPLGLPYLIFIGPFLFYFFKNLFKKKLCVLSVLVLIVWLLWWFGSQQARFLYIPLLLIFLLTLTHHIKISKVLLGCLVLALFLNIISLKGAHKRELFLSDWDVLRIQDQELANISRAYIQENRQGYVSWSEHDVAYAQFPVTVTKESLPHTVKF